MTDEDLSEQARIRNLKRAMDEADNLAKKLEIPRDTREAGTAIYRRALQEDLIPGRGIEEISAASLYLACKQNRVPRSPDDFAEYSKYDRKSILRAAKYLQSELDLNAEPFNPSKYVDRYTDELEMSVNVAETAKDIIDYGYEEGIFSGCSPTGVAAGAVYLAGRLTGEKRIQSEIASVAEVTEVTIRKRYQEQKEALPEGFLE
jgi:transcription initiation factor TFIIB